MKLKNSEQQGFDIKYQEKLGRHLDRVDNLESGLHKAYALIFTNYCTRAMQSRIEQHPDYNTTIIDNPIILLETIKTLMHATVRAQYPLMTATDALTRMVNIHQGENEALLDYIKRFKQLRDVYKSHWGDQVLDHFVENTSKYQTETDNNVRTSLKNEAFDEWMAYLVIRGSDQTKYGTLCHGFVSQFSLGNDQYPKTIQKATDALSQHKFDGKYYENQEKKREKQRDERNNRREQEEENSNQTSFAQGEIVCYCCGETGHTSQYCGKKGSIARNDWYINKAIQHLQEDEGTTDNNNNDNMDDDLSETSSVDSAVSTGSRGHRSGNRNSRSQSTNNYQSDWSGFQQPEKTEKAEHSHKQSTGLENLKNVFLLDSGSTIPATIMNPDFVTNIKTSTKQLKMRTNAGMKV